MRPKGTPEQLAIRRRQALQWLAEGLGPTEVARRIGVTRQTIYEWKARAKQERRRHSQPDRALELAPLAPTEVTLVAASGLGTRADLERLQSAGNKGFLIGETLVTSGDPGAKLREFLGRGD